MNLLPTPNADTPYFLPYQLRWLDDNVPLKKRTGVPPQGKGEGLMHRFSICGIRYAILRVTICRQAEDKQRDIEVHGVNPQRVQGASRGKTSITASLYFMRGIMEQCKRSERPLLRDNFAPLKGVCAPLRQTSNGAHSTRSMARAVTIPQDGVSLHEHAWADGHWMAHRGEHFSPDRAVSIYEVHLGSWMRVPEENNRMLTYHEIAPKLADYVQRMGYTHVLILDATEPDLMHLVNFMHQWRIGVLLDWKIPDLGAARRWLEEFHIDGLCMGDMVGTDFVRDLVGEVQRDFPGVAIIGEGSAGPFKLDRGFAHDVRSYLAHTPGERKLHHSRLTFRRMYAFQEKYILPLSHRELSPLMRMPGDEWQKFANLRLMLAYMFLQPGKKLLFMGHDFGQWREWNSNVSLDWHLAHFRYHQGVQSMVRRLNDLYFHHTALHQGDTRADCFEWIDCHDSQGSTLSWLRWNQQRQEVFLAIFNFTPRVHRNFRVGVPHGGNWHEIINTDAQEYGGSGQGNFGSVAATPFGWNDRPNSLVITVPPLAAVAFTSRPGD